MKFIDSAVIKISAGHGGAGGISFRREANIPRGGPDGGNGGKGGDVIFRATHNMATLMDFRYKRHLSAQDGQKGSTKTCDGRAGEDIIVPVPVGTVVCDFTTGDVIADFTTNHQQIVLAKGGRGGKGNAFFVNSVRQTPKFAQPGEDGENKEIRLELKLLADVGLVGCPNAGKSTFLSSISQARPKIADYPFTTLAPCLGVVRYKNAKDFVVADLPGLIEGAHQGKGMGDRFLKHAERTKVLLHLVSLSPDEVQEPLVRFKLIEKEVATYFKDKKRQRKKMVLLTKIDLVDDKTLKEITRTFKKHIKVPVIPISSVAQKNIETVLVELIKELGSSKD